MIKEIRPDVEVIFEFNNARKSFVRNGYRPGHLINDDYITTGVHHYYQTDIVQPNENVQGTITFLTPKLYPNCLWIGKRINIQEGNKIVGYATITKIFNSLLQKKYYYTHLNFKNNKNAVLGELLYIIANYEKGRIRTTSIWSKQYKDSLKKSIEIMLLIVSFLESNQNITIGDMQPIFEYINKNTLVIFPHNTIVIEEYTSNSYDKVFLSICNQEKSFIKIIQYMDRILTKCNILLVNKEKQYKTKIASLLRTFHNLPKVYLDSTAQTLCNIGIKPISEDEAIDYAESYISKKL